MSYHLTPKGQRKDTAAYASLPHLNLSKSKTSEDAVSEDNSASHRSFRSEPPGCQGNLGTANPWQHRDEPDLGSFVQRVKQFLRKSEEQPDPYPKIRPPQNKLQILTLSQALKPEF